IARDRRLREFGAKTIDLRLKRTVVDLEQDLSLLDKAAFLERHIRDEARNARPDGDRLHGLESSRELVPFRDVTRDRRRGSDLRKRWRGAFGFYPGAGG